MSKQKEYEFKKLNYTENIQNFRNYVIDTSNTKENHKQILNRYLEKMTNPEMEKVLTAFSTEDERIGIFGSRDKLVSKHLASLYEIQIAGLTGDKDLAATYRKDMKLVVGQEAEQLNKGSKFFSIDLAVKEIKNLQAELSVVKTLNAKLNTALHNLVENVKSKFGAKEYDINQMMNTAPGKELSNQKQVTNQREFVGQIATVEKDQGNYPAGVSESVDYKIYAQANGSYAIDRVFNDMDTKETKDVVGDNLRLEQLNDQFKKHIDFETNKVFLQTDLFKQGTEIKNHDHLVKEVSNLINEKKQGFEIGM